MDAARGLYVHRTMGTVTLSRFGAHPDWTVGPRVALTPLPTGRLQIELASAHGRGRTMDLLAVPSDLRDVQPWLRFVAGEGPMP